MPDVFYTEKQPSNIESKLEIIFFSHRLGVELQLWRAIREHRLQSSPNLRRTSSTETDMDTNSMVVVECQRCKCTTRRTISNHSNISNNSNCSNNPTVVIRERENGDDRVAEFYGDNGIINLWQLRGWCTLQWMVSIVLQSSYRMFLFYCIACYLLQNEIQWRRFAQTRVSSWFEITWSIPFITSMKIEHLILTTCICIH